ncbi:MAG TPA: amino acid adenylation domain-containing protein, partial [Methylomirabilota bacterium]|nr:amino acid adenylation domain-containing protein [Methylomirabilota bacterium]
EPIQLVHDHVPVLVEEIDASAWSEAELKERLVQRAHRPFDLERGPILGVTLFRRSAEHHVLLVAVHHIAIDFWSFVVLMQDLNLLYPAEVTGAPAILPPVPMDYTDYVAWQAEMMAGPEGERHWAYWRQQLAGELPVLDLPTDRPRPAAQTYAGASYAFRLDTALTGRLKALAKAEGVTVYMTVLAAFLILLHRYTEQDDILIGAPLAARTRAEFEPIVGCVTNPVVLRADLSGNPTFKAFLGQVRRTVLEALEHQDFPALPLVERLRPPRDPSRPRLYQIMFNMVRTHQFETDVLAQFALGDTGFRTNLGGLDLESFHLEYRVAVLDLEMTIGEVSGSISAHMVYNTDLFDAARIARLEGHFRALVEGIVADPEQRIGELPLLTETERRQALVDWNATALDVPDAATVHALFEAQAERTPDAVAVVDGDASLTYRELNRRANQLAHRLRALGVAPEVPVGLCLERSPEMAVALLGILKAGGAYVPLDPEYPKERLEFMVEDARPRVLVTQTRLLERLPGTPATALCLDTESARISEESGDNPSSGAGGPSLAYVIYTSGSTGRPKGVLVTHRSVVNHALAMAKRFDLRPSDRVLQFSTLSFDAAVEEIVPTWLTGAALILRPAGVTAGADFIQFIERGRVSVLDLPTAFWHAWVTELAVSGASLPASLRLVVVGGEKASAERLATWRRLKGNRIRWINTYGPTETTVTATLYEPPMDALSGATMAGIPIGRPIANTRVYLLDRHRRPVPVGVTGEIYIGGAGVARGYLNQPALTAERFVPDPFTKNPEARLFRTGDLARHRPDGEIEFIGRNDRQAKIRGFRVEPGEIEAALAEHPGVEQVVVVARMGPEADTRLVAYVVTAPEASPSARELRGFLGRKLPEYMVPSVFAFVATLPLTPSGKIDLAALPEPGRPDREDTYVAPRNAAEETLAGIFAQLLGVERVGVHDDYFDLGGHSLLAIQLMARVKAAFDVELPLRALFETPTVAGLASRVEAARRSAPSPAATPLVAIQPKGARPPLFCVHPLGGSVLCYVGLARQLGADQPVYGLEAPNLEGDQEPPANITDMAARYVDAIRARQPHGPYHLAGWSFGGLVAFEMARQLVAEGDEVALLALLDTSAPTAVARAAHGDERNLPAFREGLDRLDSEEQLGRFMTTVMGLDAVPEDLGLPEIGRARRLWSANLRATLSYEPEVFPHRITLFRAAHGRPKDPTLGWADFMSAPVEVHEVPGDHYTMLAQPHVGVLAARLRDGLRRAQGTGDSSRREET